MKNYSILKQKAIILRKKGYSLKEISEQLKIAKSTASLWSMDVELNASALERLKNNSISGRLKGTEKIVQKSRNQSILNSKDAYKIVKLANIDTHIIQIFCSLLYWGEGSKTDRCLRFTNSDPKMISTFLDFLRRGFSDIDESKFRCVLQIHEYHDEAFEIEFWSKITKISSGQFTKSYLKSHTSKVIRPGYHGTIGVKYYDSKLVDRIIAIYNTLSDIGV